MPAQRDEAAVLGLDAVGEHEALLAQQALVGLHQAGEAVRRGGIVAAAGGQNVECETSAQKSGKSATSRSKSFCEAITSTKRHPCRLTLGLTILTTADLPGRSAGGFMKLGGCHDEDRSEQDRHQCGKGSGSTRITLPKLKCCFLEVLNNVLQ